VIDRDPDPARPETTGASAGRKATVLSQIDAPDPRVGQLASSLITHLHDFIRENRVTWDEWMAGLAFLTRVGHWTSETRNESILMSDTSGCSTLVDALNNRGPANMTPTTRTPVGPPRLPRTWARAGPFPVVTEMEQAAA
jgi:Catechol dioxygenase N terminus